MAFSSLSSTLQKRKVFGGGGGQESKGGTGLVDGGCVQGRCRC